MNVSEHELKEKARKIRTLIIQMNAEKGTHIGSSLSCADIVTVLYSGVLRIDHKNPDDPERDRFIFSKGHAAPTLYAALAVHDFCDPAYVLQEFGKSGTTVVNHATRGSLPGVEVSTGSLGHGLSIGAGMALAAKRDGKKYRVFVLVSDGECGEGSTWEAINFAAHHALDNLICIIDYNKWQGFGRVADVLGLEPLKEKFMAHGWSVEEVDGHDFKAMEGAFRNLPFEKGKPNAVIAHTIKGKGISFMEDTLASHYENLKGERVMQALKEIEMG